MTYIPREENEVHCPLEYGMKMFGGKWKPRIICILSTRDIMRYTEIKKELSNLTDTALSASLKELVRDGIVEKKVFGSPQRIGYCLTPKDEEIIPILQDICEWSGRYTSLDEMNTLPQCRRCDYIVSRR